MLLQNIIDLRKGNLFYLKNVIETNCPDQRIHELIQDKYGGYTIANRANIP